MRKIHHVFLCLTAALILTAAGQRAVAAEEDEVLATCEQGVSCDDAWWKECPLGDYVADAVRAGIGTDVSLIPAGCLRMALVGDGEVTRREALEALSGDQTVMVYAMSSRQLKDILEKSVSTWTLSDRDMLDAGTSASDGYLQISGMEVKYDASAPVGDRVLLVTLAGRELDLTAEDDRITVSAPAALETGSVGTETAASMAELLCGYIAKQGTVTLPEGQRVRVIGANANNIVTKVSPWIAFVAVVIIGANALAHGRREDMADKDN